MRVHLDDCFVRGAVRGPGGRGTNGARYAVGKDADNRQIEDLSQRIDMAVIRRLPHPAEAERLVGLELDRGEGGLWFGIDDQFIEDRSADETSSRNLPDGQQSHG